jgi:rhomboid protease GluP
MNAPSKAVLCPACRRLINKQEPTCPYCGLHRPGAAWRSFAYFRVLRDPELAARAIIYLNVAMYVMTLLVYPRGTRFSMNPLTFLSPADTSLLLLGATGTIPIDRFGRWWTLLSANYLHGGILHIFFNMLAFRQLAPLVMREYGVSRSIVLYTLAGTAGFWVSYIAGIPFTIGASAAVCGLMGALLYFGKRRGGIYGQLIYRQIGGWAVGIFLFGLLVPGINNWGHAGGLVAGILIAWILGYREQRPAAGGHRMMAGLCLAVTLGVLAWALASGAYYRFSG